MTADLFAHVHHVTAPQLEMGGPLVAIDIAGDQSPFCDLRPGPAPEARFAAVTWTTTPDAIGDRAWRVDRSVVWDDGDPVGGPLPQGALKQVSLVRRRADQSRTDFADLYRGHGAVARKHHGMIRYAQNIVMEAVYGVEDDTEDIDGISELWFASRGDWSDRFYLHEDSPAAVREDTLRFIDFKSTGSAMVQT